MEGRRDGHTAASGTRAPQRTLRRKMKGIQRKTKGIQRKTKGMTAPTHIKTIDH
jgi:hypothetical protein